jgi:hypothetical protein
MAYEDKYPPEIRRAFRKEFWENMAKWDRIDRARRLKKMRSQDQIEVGYLKIHDWKILGELCARHWEEWSQADSIDTILRSARMDARYLEPNRITKNHLRLAAYLTTIGRTTAGPKHDGTKTDK